MYSVKISSNYQVCHEEFKNLPLTQVASEIKALIENINFSGPTFTCCVVVSHQDLYNRFASFIIHAATEADVDTPVYI